MREAGATAFVEKDVTEDQLHRAIKRALERHHTLWKQSRTSPPVIFKETAGPTLSLL
jgi:hypothetical protein